MEENSQPRSNKLAASAGILAFLIITTAFTIGNVGGNSVIDPCINPPKTNPNQCHLFKWAPFPTDINKIPPTGIFNNDSSYQFGYPLLGATGQITQFEICANVISVSNPNSNATLILQYQEPGGFWANVDSSSSRSGGALVIPVAVSANAVCSATVGTFNSTLVNDNCIPPQGICNFRIGGNEGICASCSGPDTMVISTLNVVFILGNINTVVICATSSHTLASATIQCKASIVQTSLATISISWEADNRSGMGAGCGLLDICQKVGTSICSIAVGGTTCQVIASFGMTFQGTVFLAISQNTVGLSSLITPSLAVPVLV